MPNDPNISLYGLGKGAAQVIDTTSGAQQQFGQILARQQQQRQQELKQLTDQQAQLKPDGLRNDADRQDFFNQVNDWRNKSIAAINERDPYKKSLAQSQAQQAYMQAQQTVNKSKEQGLRDNAFNQFAMNNATRHQLTDEAVQKGLANMKVGVNNPNIINDYGTLQRAPDYEAFDKKNTGFLTKHWNNAVEQDVLGQPQQIAGNTVTPWSKVKKIDPLLLAHDIMNEATFNPNYAVALEASYPDLYANAKTDDDFHVAHALAATRLANEQELQKTVNTGYMPAKETDAEKLDLNKKIWDYRIKHPMPSQGIANSAAPNAIQNYVTAAYNGDTNAGKAYVSYIDTKKNNMKPGDKPDYVVENGKRYVVIPPVYDPKTLKTMDAAQKAYEAKGGTQGSLWWKEKVPWEQSDQFKKLQPSFAPKEDAQKIPLPDDEIGYRAAMAKIGHDYGLPISAINEAGGLHNQKLQQKLGTNALPTTKPIKKLTHGGLNDL